MVVEDKVKAATVRSGAIPPPALCCRGTSKRYGPRWVVRDFSLQLAHGQSLALVGLNGAGKTSVLKMVLDFSRPDTGSVSLYGLPASRASARRALAYLPERFSPPPDLSGMQVLKLMAGLRGDLIDPRICRIRLQELDLPLDALYRPVRQFSKGMTQKLGLCAALIADCPLTVLDEPFSGLDPLARRSVVNAMLALRASGKSLLFTSHSLNGLPELCDRIGVIHEGGLRFLGTPGDLLEKFAAQDIESAFIRCIGQSDVDQSL